MLNPDNRNLYTSALTPPPGMVFDEAVATTFSLEPTFLLQAPVYLALMASDSQQTNDPFACFEAIRRYADRITVYVQQGRIQVPATHSASPLLGLLEKMIVEANAPKGGVFHPKVWAIRYITPSDDTVMYRLVILSRNLTTDSSWDLSLQLEGKLSKAKCKGNQPLQYLFRHLPELAAGKVDQTRQQQAIRFADELRCVVWDLPPGYDSLTFYLPGISPFKWQPPQATRIAIISPFCSDDALQYLVPCNSTQNVLISRPETLLALNDETLTPFDNVLHLDEAAEPDASSLDDVITASGLHAKAYLFESGWDCELVLGSANATRAALCQGKNVEILVSLKGRKSKTGSIESMLSQEGFGNYLVEFDKNLEPEIDALRVEAEKALEHARQLLAHAALSLHCGQGQTEEIWALFLCGLIPPLPGIEHIRVWPITVAPTFACELPTEGTAQDMLLGEFSAFTLTGLIAFELDTRHPNVSARFVLNLPIANVPDDRNASILKTIINKQEDFLRYLYMLLGTEHVALLRNEGRTTTKNVLYSLAHKDNTPLLEELTRLYSRTPERLKDIAALVDGLRNHALDIVPDDFLNLWAVFESAMDKHHER